MKFKKTLLKIVLITIILSVTVEFINVGITVFKEGLDIFSQRTPVFDLASITNKRTRYDTVLSNYYVFDGTLGRRFKPNSRLIALEANEDGTPRIATDRQLFVNSLGFVSNTNDPNKVPNYKGIMTDNDVFIIVVSGGSTTTGWGATDNENTWPSILERMLNRFPNPLRHQYREIVIINTGVFGYNISKEIKRFAEETYYYRPNLVLAFNGINERWEYSGNPVDYATGGSQYRMMNHFNCGWTATKNMASLFLPYTVNNISLLLNYISPSPCDCKQMQQIYAYKAYPGKMEDVELYISKISQFKVLSESAGADFIYAFQPIMGSCNKPLTQFEESIKHFFGSDFYKEPWDRYQHRLEKFYVAVRSRLKATWQYDLSCMFQTETRTVFSDPRHYNDLGQKQIAEKLFNILSSAYANTEIQEN